MLLRNSNGGPAGVLNMLLMADGVNTVQIIIIITALQSQLTLLMQF